MSPARKVLIPLMISLTLLAGGCKSSGSSNTGAAGSSQPTAAATSEAPVASATPGSPCPTANTTSFAKSKFVLHTGLAFGAFHRYLYKPFRAGTFTTGSGLHRAATFAKAGAAALFIKREVRLAAVDVKANPTLCNTLAAPLASLSDTITAAVTKLKAGDSTGIEDAQKAVAGIEGSAARGGAPITEDPNASIG